MTHHNQLPQPSKSEIASHVIGLMIQACADEELYKKSTAVNGLRPNRFADLVNDTIVTQQRMRTQQLINETLLELGSLPLSVMEKGRRTDINLTAWHGPVQGMSDVHEWSTAGSPAIMRLPGMPVLDQLRANL